MRQPALAFAGRKGASVAPWAGSSYTGSHTGRAMPHSNADQERRDIDWNYWRQMLMVEPWEAVALSLNVDPENPRGEPEVDLGSESELESIYPGGVPWVDRDYDEKFLENLMKSEKFHRRLKIVESHFGTNPLSLPEFVRWAQSMELFHLPPMPPELISLAEPISQARLTLPHGDQSLIDFQLDRGHWSVTFSGKTEKVNTTDGMHY